MGIIKNIFKKIFKRKKQLTPEQREAIATKDFFDRMLPGTVKFYSDHYICGNYYKSVWAITEYPPNTEENALLAHLADRSGVSLRIYNRLVSALEQKKIMQQAARKNHMMSGTNDINESVKAEENMNDIVNLLAELKRDRETLLHTAVFIELKADTEDKLKELQADIQMELTRSKISFDKLLLRQKEGFIAILPAGSNVLGTQCERVLPSSSAANLYPLNYSGKTDPNGFYLGRDKYGSNILVDFDKRTDDKTNSNILILGNSGQGKSYLMKLLICNMRESGKSVICLDPESEYEDLCNNLGGTYIDMMSGEYMINPLEPKSFGEADRSADAPDTFRKITRLSQHISYLKDFFRAYKDFSDSEIDTLEIMLIKLYNRFGIDDNTDYSKLTAADYPTMADLYELTEMEYKAYDRGKKNLYTEDTLQNICLGIYSMCKGAEAQYFCGHTNIKDGEFLCFGVKGIMDTNRQLKGTLLFNILSYMSSQLLGKGNTVAAIDELYLFLSNMTAIEYIRNGMKRVRKKESAFILASQNIEDFLIPEVKEFTKPLFSIPTHSFYFNVGNCSAVDFMDTVQLLKPEYDLIAHPERGTCLYRCGNERYLLQVHAPAYKEALFGKAGGR
ncbi:MAG: ATP-binding protein [Ruminococcus sp.]|nr:ATP-binding protein [Ruminococcus sp.]